MRRLTTEASLVELVSEQASEGRELEFKSSRLTTNKEPDKAIKDISVTLAAFANSTGGNLIVGIEESKVKPPCAMEIVGIIDSRWEAQWVQSKLESLITPRILNMSVHQIALADQSWCLVFEVPASARAPHQSWDNKYYARRQFQTLPMDHYEIEDIRSRQRVRRGDIRFSLVLDQNVFVELQVENLGDQPVSDLRFHFPDVAKAAFELEAPAFEHGISALNPGEKRQFHIGVLTELFSHDVLKTDVRLELTYNDTDGEIQSRHLVFNLTNYDRSSWQLTDVDRLRDSLEKQAKDVISALQKIGNTLDSQLSPLSTSTGLSLSLDAIAALKSIGPTADGAYPKRCADELSWQGLRAVLECDDSVAIRLHRYLKHIGGGIKTPEEIEGVTPEISLRIRERLYSVRRML